MLLAIGHPGSLVEEVRDAYLPDFNLRFCLGQDELMAGLEVGEKVILPIGNTVYGRNLPIYRALLAKNLQLIDQFEVEPEYFLASKSTSFEVVCGSSESLDLTDRHWREHRSYLLKRSPAVEALSLAQQHYQYAAVCTRREAEQFGLKIQQKLEHDSIKQRFGLVGWRMSSDVYEYSELALACGDCGAAKVAEILYAFAVADVQLLDLQMLEDGFLLVKIATDMRQARARNALRAIKGIAEYNILGGKLVRSEPTGQAS